MLKQSQKKIIATLVAVAVTAIFVPIASSSYREIKLNRRFIEEGKTVQGVVASHRQATSKSRSCLVEAIVTYKVSEQIFTTANGGCDLTESNLPVGRAVDVLYLPSNPGLSTIKRNDFDLRRSAWLSLLFLAGSCALGYFAAYQYATKRNDDS